MGAFGGIVAELSRLWSIRESQNFPIYLSHKKYWLITFAMIFVGGLLTPIFCGTGEITALSALGVGASAPLMITTLTKGATIPSTDKKGGSPPQIPIDETLIAFCMGYSRQSGKKISGLYHYLLELYHIWGYLKNLKGPSIISYLRGD